MGERVWSNEVKVKDAKYVAEALRRCVYPQTSYFRLMLEGQTLKAIGNSCPAVWLLPDGEDKDAFELSITEDWNEREAGDLENLLQVLSTKIESPFVIRYADIEEGCVSAREWHVHLSGEIKVTSIGMSTDSEADRRFALLQSIGLDNWTPETEQP